MCFRTSCEDGLISGEREPLEEASLQSLRNKTRQSRISRSDGGASQRSGNDASGSTLGRRPVRQNTADLFRDDEEVGPNEEEIENQMGAEGPVEDDVEAKQATAKKAPALPIRNFTPFSKAPSPLQNRVSSQDGGLGVYDLGRDGGGSRSGAASPLYVSDEDNGLNTPSTAKDSDSVDPRKQTFQPRSLAHALRGDFDDPNRVLADALGDQSDAEVDEADIEVGTKEKEESEMRQILEDERNDRSRK